MMHDVSELFPEAIRVCLACRFRVGGNRMNAIKIEKKLSRQVGQ
jgi:hypothetical protein